MSKDMPTLGSEAYTALNREYDGLKPTFKRKERLKGSKSKFYPVFIGRGFTGLGLDEGGFIVEPSQITPKIGKSEKGRTGRFGHSDYRGNK